MAASFATFASNDRQGLRRETYTDTVFAVGTLNGSVEGIVGLPYSDVTGEGSGNGWELESVILSAGTNTTHDTSASITATVEKNTDGGTTALATAPVITDAAGTGRKSTVAAGTGITQAVVHGTAANRQFADGDVAFVTLTEAGTGGSDPADVSVTLTFSRLQDFDPVA